MRSPAQGANVLSIENLSVDFRTPAGPLRALRDVSLEVPRGSILGIVGESGCGKTTLINAILGLLAANGEVAGGRILYNDQDLLAMDPAALRALRGERITVVFQDPMTTLNPVFSIGTQMVNIQYRSRRSRSEKLARAADMLGKVKIPDPERRLKQYPHQFSGGMRQRIAIAMALMQEPDLLIADEPTTALDATLEVQVIQLLRELQSDIGCSVLFISHHLGVIAEVCDRVAVMYAGEVAERGTVRDIFHRARHPYSEKLLQCDPARIREPTRRLPTIPGDLPDLVHMPPGCIFRPRCHRAFKRCEHERPPPYRVSEGHTAACHLVDEERPP
ncbi:MAG TPA: ABC transporter ATP-binding protein [Aestuariivirgaceae bacterium]|nr:ABC transporter ATP-binding protein [Aestuariivirgaceae bacterium]